LGFSALAAAAALAAALPAQAGDDWGDYGWGGFGGWGGHSGYGRPDSGWRERVRRDGNVVYQAYNSWDGYDRDYWGYAYDRYDGADGYGWSRWEHRRYGGYWTRPSDRRAYGYGYGYGTERWRGRRQGWRGGFDEYAYKARCQGREGYYGRANPYLRHDRDHQGCPG
jgi:hypothetical protein